MSPRRRLPREVRGWIGPTVSATLLVGGLLYYVGSLPHTVPEAVLVILLTGAAASLVLWALTRTGQEVERAYWVSTPRQEAVPPAALDYRLLRLRRDLRDAVERDDRQDAIYPVLRELTAERLQARHGVDLDAEPERARALLDPALQQYLDRPPTDTRRRSRSALHTAIEGIERL